MTTAKTKFLNPEALLFQAGLAAGQAMADLGTGSGYFALAGAKIVGPRGEVHVVDVQEPALDHVVTEARLKHLGNIRTYRANLDAKGLPARLPLGTCDLVVLTNILHEVEDRANLFRHTYALLKTGGKVLLVDWNQKPGPIGPPANRRVSSEEAAALSAKSGFRLVNHLETDDYHYGLVLEK